MQELPTADSLLEAVKQTKPTVLIGLSDDVPPHAFSKEVRDLGGAAGGGGEGPGGLGALCCWMLLAEVRGWGWRLRVQREGFWVCVYPGIWGGMLH